jgi:hypothetical protein
MLYAIDTKEKLNWFINALENEEIIIGGGREWTEEECEEVSKAIADHKANRLKQVEEHAIA